MKVRCPHCQKSIGGIATEGGLRLRLGIVLVDPVDGRIHGPCPSCKQDVVLGDNRGLNKSLIGADRSVIPGLHRIRR